MSFKAIHKPEENHEAWLMTYADFITLMAGFFILILSICEPKTEKMEKMVDGITSGFVKNTIEKPFKALYQDFQLIIEDNAVELQVAATYTTDGVTLDMASSSLFSPGSAELQPDSLPMLKDMVLSIQQMKLKEYLVEIEGHTDDSPLPVGAKFASNWELSAARSARVVRYFIEQGIEPTKLKVSAFADTRPKVPNLDAQGQAIFENQEQNRRVMVNIKRVL